MQRSGLRVSLWVVGGHKMVAEELPDGRRQIQFGHTPHIETKAATAFATAPLYAVYSSEGLWLRGSVSASCAGSNCTTAPTPKPRPVHYNCWEAVYFDHQLPVLKEIANKAADLGAERFVLDDGWFGQRDDDTQSLGDWVINAHKYPDGLKPLIDHVHALGMGFGLWFEPEMINPNSQVFRQSPHWATGAARSNSWPSTKGAQYGEPRSSCLFIRLSGQNFD